MRLESARWLVLVSSLGFGIAACGGDDDDGAGGASTGTASSSSSSSSSSGSGAEGGSGAVGGGGSSSSSGGGGAAGGAGGAGGDQGGGGTGGSAGGDGGSGGGSGGQGGLSAGGAGGGGSNAGGAGGGEVCAGSGGAGGGGGGGGPEIVIGLPGTVVSTLAGSDMPGSDDGLGDGAGFANPVNLVVDASGQLVVSDFDNGRLREVTALGDVTTLTDQPDFVRPFGLAIDSTGALFVQTDSNPLGQNTMLTGTIWQVSTSTGVATPIAANLGRPRGMVALPTGEIALSDLTHHTISLIDPVTAEVTLLAGLADCGGFQDGTGSAARFHHPYGLALAANGDILVADQSNHSVRRITLAGVVTTFAGDGTAGMVDGLVAASRFAFPRDLAVDGTGHVYVSDVGNHRIRRIDIAGAVTTVAGDGTAGFANGPGAAARFYGQEGIDVLPDGSVLYVADGSNGEVQPFHRIRKITLP